MFIDTADKGFCWCWWQNFIEVSLVYFESMIHNAFNAFNNNIPTVSQNRVYLITTLEKWKVETKARDDVG